METYYSKKDLIKAKNDDTNYVYDLTDLEEFLKYVPTADVVLRDEVAKIFEEIDRFIELYNNEAYYSIGELTYDVNMLKEKYAKGEEGK